MTIASLVVKLGAETLEFHRNMERAAQHMERVGRRIAKAGIEITKLFSPITALGVAALTAAIKQSALVHGELAQTWELLSLRGRQLLREIGSALTPAFIRIADAQGGLIERARQLVAWFTNLSPATQNLIIKIGIFLAVLGPTVWAIGTVIKALGALYAMFVMLAAFLWAQVIKAFAFLVTPMGMTVVGIGLLIVALGLLIRHWAIVKQTGLETWAALKLGVLEAVDGMLWALESFASGFDNLWEGIVTANMAIVKELLWVARTLATLAHLPGVVEKIDAVERSLTGLAATATSGLAPKITAARDALGVMRLEAIRDAAAIDKLGDSVVRLPLLPDWLTKGFKGLMDKFTLPTVPKMGGLAGLQAEDTLAKLQTALKAAQVSAGAFGSSFDLAGAQAAAFKTAIDELIRMGIGLDTVLNGNGLTIRKLGLEFQNLSGQIHLALGPSISQALQGFASAIGDVLGGATKSLAGFGAALLAVVGDTMVSLGAALVALGTAKLAAINMNPFAAIAAGAALIVFGKALSNAASAIANPAEAGGGGGGSASTGVGSSQGDGKIILELHGDGIVHSLFSDPRNQDALAAALQDMSGRNVTIVTVPA